MKRTLIALLMLAILASAGCTSRSGDVYVYEVECTGPVIENQCSGKWSPLNRQLYTIFAEQQIVVYTSVFGPDRLSKCAVQNVENWQCEYSDGSAIFRMIDGKFSKVVNKEMVSTLTLEWDKRRRFVPWWKYAQIWLRVFAFE